MACACGDIHYGLGYEGMGRCLGRCRYCGGEHCGANYCLLTPDAMVRIDDEQHSCYACDMTPDGVCKVHRKGGPWKEETCSLPEGHEGEHRFRPWDGGHGWCAAKKGGP